jgi:hypothetical protein
MSASILLTGRDGKAHSGSDYVLAPDAALMVMDNGNAFVVNMADNFYALPPIAAAMLRHTLEHGSAAALAKIVARYDADADTIAQDLEIFLAQLVEQGVISHVDEPPPPPPSSLGARALAAVVRLFCAALPGVKARMAVALTLSRLSFSLFGWLPTLSAWRASFPLAAAATPSAGAEEKASRISDIVRAVAAKLPFGADCKERALSAWALARLAGIPAELVVGIMHYPLGGHTWCRVGASVVGDDAENCGRYTPVFRYA